MTNLRRLIQLFSIGAILVFCNLVVAVDNLSQLRTRNLMLTKKPTRKPTSRQPNGRQAPTKAPTRRNPTKPTVPLRNPCHFCIHGGPPTATLTWIYTNVTKRSTDFYCREYYQKSLYTHANDPYCIVARRHVNQVKCGCRGA